MFNIEELILIDKDNLEATLKKIGHIYLNLEKEFINCITPKKPKQIGGTYYGSTELLQTSGNHFKSEIGYTEHCYGGTSIYYDFVFKVGGEHYNEFKQIKDVFIQCFHKNINDLLIEEGFELIDGSYYINYYNRELTIRLVDEVNFGSNFSVYCGLMISIKDDNLLKNFKKEYIKKLIIEK